MEFNGIAIDVERLSEMSDLFRKQLEKLQDEIYRLAGSTFNIP